MVGNLGFGKGFILAPEQVDLRGVQVARLAVWYSNTVCSRAAIG
jgi:hypothetical protein